MGSPASTSRSGSLSIFCQSRSWEMSIFILSALLLGIHGERYLTTGTSARSRQREPCCVT